jgi:CheY-like chemotaxis protein/anti-sigma regulatory factor (Ser/Thr protein kinase)
MLAFARRENLEPGVVNLNEAARGIVAALYGVIGPAVEIKTEFAHELWPVRADLRQLELALVNLARNASEAMPGGGRLTISAYNETIAQPVDELAAGDYVRLSVVDTGAGMSEAILARAVDPFFTTKEAGVGAGLGLPLVQGFAVQSGGTLRLSSKPGEGTKVELWLPRAIKLVKVKSPAAAQTPETFHPSTVLVVDDDALIVMVTSDRLQALGHHVFEVQSGRQALEVLRSSVRIDVVLTDHVMPGMTGLELAREIRANWPDLPIILATGCSDLPDVAELRLTRLDKPYDLDTLAATIAELTGEKPAS